VNSLELKQYKMNNINILKVRVLTEKKLFHRESSAKVLAVFIYSQFSVVSGNRFMVYLIRLAGSVHLTWSQSQLLINPIQSRCLIAKVMIGCKWLQSKALYALI